MDTQPCRAPEYHDMAYKREGAPHHVRPHQGNAEPVTSVPGAALEVPWKTKQLILRAFIKHLTRIMP